MSDPLANWGKGQPIALRADTMNAWNDAARATKRARHGGGAGNSFAEIVPSLTVYIRNDTGGDLDERSVVRILDWVVSPVDFPFEVLDRPVLSADTPNATTNLIAILSEPILDGEYGKAVIPGPVAVVDILINDSGHEWAQPIDGDSTRLSSATSGPARIVAKESSGTTRRAIVLLGDGRGNPKAQWIYFTLPGALATTDASKASCTVNDFWQGSDPGSTVTVYNAPASTNYIFSGASGNKGMACYDDIEDKYRIVQMECP